MGDIDLANARAAEIDDAVESTEPRRMDVQLAFKDVFLTYVGECRRARPWITELRLSPIVYDRAQALGLFGVVGYRYPGLELIRKSRG